LDQVSEWIAERRDAVEVSCRPVPWSELREWKQVGGRIVHRAGGFFSVAGLAARMPAVEVSQPIIVQPEVGILGFAVRRRGAAREILLQAKAEPGNLRGVQVGPTVQATESNCKRVHGGRPTPYLELFTRPLPGSRVADSLQSEQGTRFLGKYNRNAMVDASGP
jgi:oxidase EvaA